MTYETPGFNDKTKVNNAFGEGMSLPNFAMGNVLAGLHIACGERLATLRSEATESIRSAGEAVLGAVARRILPRL